MTLALVVLASAVGAPLRYVVDREVQRRHRRAFPFGTLGINVVGSLLLGVVVGLHERHGLASSAMTVLGVGLLGSFTTFSTFVWETLRLVEDRRAAAAMANVVVSIAVGLAAAYVGLAIT